MKTETTLDTNSDARLFSLELFIAKFLRYGVLFAAVLLFVGWASQIDFQRDTFATFAQYRNIPLRDVLSQAFANHSYGLLTSYLGLAVLIALPVIRVLLTALVFVFERDFILAACAGLVLFGLACSLMLGYQI